MNRVARGKLVINWGKGGCDIRLIIINQRFRVGEREREKKEAEEKIGGKNLVTIRSFLSH